MAALSSLIRFAPAANGQITPGSEPPALDPVTGTVHSRRLASGVPLGSLGTGTFQLLTDGTISRATLMNNWQQPTGDLPGCFAALWTRISGRTAHAQVLALNSGYGLPVIKTLDYSGQPPLASLTYADPAIPLKVSLRAFSPLIPFDIKNSTFPAAAFVFQFRNTSNEPIEISLALSWENLLGRGGATAAGTPQNKRDSTIVSLPSAEGFFGLHFIGPPLTPGNSTSERLQDNATGDMALLVMPPRKESVVTQTGWNTADAKPGWWATFAQTGDVMNVAPTGSDGKGAAAGVVTIRLTLRPNDFTEIPFAVAWHAPHYNTLSGVDYGHHDALLYPDAMQAARALLTEWRSLLALTAEWQQALRFSNLPRWLVRRLMNSVTPLQTNTLYTQDGRLALLRGAGGISGAQIVGPQQAPAMDALLTDFFPQLKAQTVRNGTPSDPAFLDAEYSLTQPNPDRKKEPFAALLKDALAESIAAIALINAGKPEEGVAALKNLDATRDNILLTPWIAPETLTATDSPLYASLAQAGDWLALNALTGFAYDSAALRLTITPHIPGTWRSLRAPVFAPTFRAYIEYTPQAHGGRITFHLDRLIVTPADAAPRRPAKNAQFVLNSLRVPAPPHSDASPRTVHVSRFQTALGSTTTVDPKNGDLILTLDTPLTLTAGDRLEIDVH